MSAGTLQNDEPRPVSNAEAPPPARVERPAGTRARWTRGRADGWSAAALARWTFMLLLFLYLLALAMTLFEIDAFQNQVAEMVATEPGTRASNVRQREVLQAIRSTDPRDRPVRDAGAVSGDSTGEIHARIAAKLDPLLVAVEMLQTIGDDATVSFSERSDEAFIRSQQEAFGELASRVELAVADLRKQVAALRSCDEPGRPGCARAAKVARDLQDLNLAAARLGALFPPGAAARPEPGAAEPRQVGEDRLEDARALAGAVVERGQEIVAALRAGADLDALAVSGLVDGLRADLDRLQELSPAEARALSQDVYAPAADPPAAGEQRAVSPENQLRRLRLALRRLRAYVASQAGIDLREIGALTRELANIEVAARQLGELQIDISPGGGADRGGVAERQDESRRRYQKAAADLTTAIASMRKSLNDTSSVGLIADAIGDQDPQAYRKALTLEREYDALVRYQHILTPLAELRVPVPRCGDASAARTGSADDRAVGEDAAGADRQQSLGCFKRIAARLWNRLADVGFHAKDMATMTRQALDMMVVFVMGAIGSLIYLIRYLLSQTLHSPDKGSPVWRPLSWYLFRPLFGIVVAFAIYLLYKTGQVALGGANSNVLASDVNLPILSVFSLFAGLLSWQALEMVESRGRRWLSAQRRESLWASGLRAALRQAGKTESECAAQVGVTPTQVERWVSGHDKVTPEMQDRILTWLDRERVELFGDVNPRDIDDASLEWATGLKGVLESNPAGIDVPRLAQLLEQDVETVQAWVDLKRQVDSQMQLLIADKLGVPRSRLFSPERPDAEYWAVGLRSALHKGASTITSAAALAEAVGSTPRKIRQYMELRDSVPKAVQTLIADVLRVDHQLLFSPSRPLDSEYRWAAKLRECLRGSGFGSAAALAERLDVEEGWVRSWMEQEICGEEDPPYCGQVPPATQPELAQALGCEPQTLLRSERPAADFRWAVMPRFGELVRARGGVGELAGRLDLDASRIERWMSGAEPVAPDTQLALLQDLQLPVEELSGLFTRRPPPDPARPQAALWATGLRAAVRANPGVRTLGALAAALQVPPGQLYDAAEMLEPVGADLRDGIVRMLGPAAPGTPAPFSNQAPDWSRFRWAPQLRDAMAEAQLSARELAEALDVDVERVLDWMEMDEGPAGTVWAKDKVQRGQICPATCAALVDALGTAITAEQLFAAERPRTGGLWAVRPTFELAVRDFDGGLAGFAEQIDAEPERVRRWIAQTEPVAAATQQRILAVLGLEAGDAWQVFSAAAHATKEGLG